MRMRKKKNGDKRREALSHLFVQSEFVNEHCAEKCFGNENPVHIEIGCGKGAFITELAKRNPDINYIAIEVVSDAIVCAIEKADAIGISNLKFLICNAANLTDIFSKESIDKIYLNFSDPWPKKRHAKRRLTSPVFLSTYKTILKHGANIEFKTDNRDLFDYSLEQFENCEFDLSDICYDLHASEYAKDNIMTEYEANFSQKGFKINRLCAHYR